MNMGPRWLGTRWLGADLIRDFFQTGAEVVVGPRWHGAEVTRGRGGSGAEVSEFHFIDKYVVHGRFNDKAEILDRCLYWLLWDDNSLRLAIVVS